MSDSPNPYAPPSAAPSPAGAEWMANDPAALSRTAFGLSLVYYGILLILLSIILFFALGFVFGLAAILAAPGFLIGSILMFVGPLFCLTVPAETNAKGLIITAVVLQIINIVAVLLQFAGVDLAGFDSFAQIFSVLSAIFFVLFMRRLARYLGREDLAKRASNILVGGFVSFFGAIASGVLAFLIGPAISLMLLVFAIVGIVIFVMYANLVHTLSKALKEARAPT
ncbi:MAG: hypothetical protein ACPGLY_05870 [Rubripirellula sp.]